VSVTIDVDIVGEMSFELQVRLTIARYTVDSFYLLTPKKEKTISKC
jgi:hypothetical protein